MGWRDIRKYTDRSVARVDRATAEKNRKSSEVSNILTKGVSLFQKYTQGKADQAALETFGESEDLTYDKKSKTFYGTTESKEQIDEEGYSMTPEHADYKAQSFQISPAELKNMQNFSKYTDKGISDFISTKDGNIKKGFQSEGMPVYEKTFMEKMKKNKGMSVGDYGKTAWGLLTQESKVKSSPSTQAPLQVSGQNTSGTFSTLSDTPHKADKNKDMGWGDYAKWVGGTLTQQSKVKSSPSTQAPLQMTPESDYQKQLQSGTGASFSTFQPATPKPKTDSGDGDVGGRERWFDVLFNNEDEGYDAR